MNIVHGDIRPENILFINNKDYNVKVTDLGCAFYYKGDGYDYIQTRPYRSPEVTIENICDFKSDIFSLGCLLYELITFKLLFNYNSVQKNLAKLMAINQQFYYPCEQGVILLNNQFPYKKEIENERQIEICCPDLQYNFKKEMSEFGSDEDLIDFIYMCIRINPCERMSVEQALKHKFVKKKF